MKKADLVQLKKLHADRIRRQYEGVVGVGVSRKMKDGVVGDTLALTVYVQRKRHASRLPIMQRIDLDPLLRQALEQDADLDVKEMGRLRALNAWAVPVAAVAAARTGRYRPVLTGASEGHYKVTAGTGAVLVKDAEGTVLRLSNNHIYANQNEAHQGDPIYQPAPYDAPMERSGVVGHLRKFVLLSFEGVNKVDAALRTVEGEEYQEVIELKAAPQHVLTAQLAMAVVKSGRTTGVTHGVVVDTDAMLLIGYGGGREVLFDDQIIVEGERFSQGGDSGSAVFVGNAALPWVGLLFAGNETGAMTICNHASAVQALLSVMLLTGSDAPPPPDEPSKGCSPFG